MLSMLSLSMTYVGDPLEVPALSGEEEPEPARLSKQKALFCPLD
jgi:hypothetical protein